MKIDSTKNMLNVLRLKFFLIACCLLHSVVLDAQVWEKLKASPYHNMRHNDICEFGGCFWVVNGSGKIFKSIDRGANWSLLYHNPKAHIRSIVFIDSLVGFYANLGPGVYPLTEDTTALYRTDDGGNSWLPVTIKGTQPAGICNLKTSLNDKMIYGTGRIGGPSSFIVSNDWGDSWKSVQLPTDMKLAIDVHFWDKQNGIIVGGNDSVLAKSSPLVYRTSDQGKSWSRVFVSPYVGGVCWKIQILKNGVAYVSVMDHHNNGYYLYSENVYKYPEFKIMPLGPGIFAAKGIFFKDEKNGWIGGDDKSAPIKTVDGGKTWFLDKALGYNINKFIKTGWGGVYAVGNYIYTLN
jgi:photosystem II stability/assembly factor-like uncharacterized protein